MEQVLELAKKVAQEAEVFSVSYEETPVQFENNRLKLLQGLEGSGTALRLIKDGRIGFAASNRGGEPATLVDMAVETAPLGPEAHFSFPALGGYSLVEVCDRAVDEVAVEQMVHQGQTLIDKVRSVESAILCQVGLSKHSSTIRVINSTGGEATYQKTSFSIHLEGTLVRGTDMLFVGDGEASCNFIASTESIAQTVITQLERAREIAPAPVGQVPVIFTPHGVASALISPLAVAFNGKIVLQGASPLGNRLGDKVFDECFSLWDDATLPWRAASSPFDDEGVPTKRLTLVDKGVVSQFLYDLQTAGAAGTQSTGSASRSLGSLPSPSTSTLIIKEGDTSCEDLLRSISSGLVVEELMGAGQGNMLGGDFSGNVLLGYRIANGQLVGRVKNTVIFGNVYELLSNLIAVGDKGRWVGGGIFTPFLCSTHLTVASKGED